MQSNSRERLLNTATVALGALVLSSHALYNGFPFVYPDTGTYVAACLDHFIPKDRPLTYSFFLRHLSLKETLWIPFFVQCILMSWLVFMAFRHFTSVKKIRPWHLSTVVVLAFTTGLAAVTGLLIPDLFTAVTVLTGALLLFGERISRRMRIFLILLMAYATTTHLSHYPLVCALTATLVVVWFFRRKQEGAAVFLKRTAAIALTVPIAIAMTLLTNYSVGHRWQFSPGSSHVFMMNRLIQCGIVNDYLDKSCSTRHSTLCDHRPVIGQDFLWDSNSPINAQYGWDGWDDAKPEYDSIISDILTQPDYFWRYAGANVRDASIQLYTFDVWPMVPLNGGASYDVIRAHFPNDHAQYVRSLQSQGKVSYAAIDVAQKMVVALSALALAALLLLRRFRNRMPVLRPLVLWTAASMIFNAATVVSFAMIDSRYQLRLVWILPLLLLCCIAHLVSGQNTSVRDTPR
jgi:hypothetical protein